MNQRNVPLWHTISSFALLRDAQYTKEMCYVKYGSDHKGRKKGYTTEKHTYELSCDVHISKPNMLPMHKVSQKVKVILFEGVCTIKFRDQYMTNAISLEMYALKAIRKDIDLRLYTDSTIIVLS